MKLIIREKAVDDIHLAAEWYRSISIDLKDSFLNELKISLDRIEKNPAIGHAYSTKARIIWMDRFPYSIVYKLLNDKKFIAVVGVFHNRKHPNSKLSRI
ncbi:MAG: type II toxin-antitoxin system RelE/ParE family toxin [Bacteroidetes bacterium]|nr:type II toxin-antitoxin system RelE/ParE family toxin [Bacteroidota bacterium]